jgi:hypothetical protein
VIDSTGVQPEFGFARANRSGRSRSFGHHRRRDPRAPPRALSLCLAFRASGSAARHRLRGRIRHAAARRARRGKGGGAGPRPLGGGHRLRGAALRRLAAELPRRRRDGVPLRGGLRHHRFPGDRRTPPGARPIPRAPGRHAASEGTPRRLGPHHAVRRPQPPPSARLHRGTLPGHAGAPSAGRDRLPRQVQKVRIRSILSRSESRLPDLRQDLPRYYLSHPQALLRRLVSTLRYGFSNRYVTIVWQNPAA